MTTTQTTHAHARRFRTQEAEDAFNSLRECKCRACRRGGAGHAIYRKVGARDSGATTAHVPLERLNHEQLLAEGFRRWGNIHLVKPGQKAREGRSNCFERLMAMKDEVVAEFVAANPGKEVPELVITTRKNQSLKNWFLIRDREKALEARETRVVSVNRSFWTGMLKEGMSAPEQQAAEQELAEAEAQEGAVGSATVSATGTEVRHDEAPAGPEVVAPDEPPQTQEPAPQGGFWERTSSLFGGDRK